MSATRDSRDMQAKIGRYYHNHSRAIAIILMGLLLVVGAWVLRVKLVPYKGMFPTDNLGRQPSGQ